MAMERDIKMALPDTSPNTAERSFRNPRRCSPEASVSLRPAMKPRNDSSQLSNAAPVSTEGQPGSVAPPGKQEHRQRSESISSAEDWFKQTNENVEAGNDDLFHEPPFYLDSNPNGSHSGYGGPRQMGWDSARFASRDSENSDLRDVIDDLTVENRKLKRRLKRYAKNDLSDMHRDKMFEVRVHGLSASRQRDLEELLKDFVTKVNVKEHRPPGSSTNTSSKYVGTSAQSRSSKQMPPLPADSGYASNAKSGTGSHSHSGHTSNSTSSHGRAAPNLSLKSRNKNIQAYLHNIPESLMPKVMSRAMSDRERKKVVVQRLEHIFTGRSAAPGPHSQPLQQQEVSNSAARENRFKFEGQREAQIMNNRRRLDLERQNNSNSAGSDESPRDSEAQGGNGSQGSEQRPTRPLDLDIHRAQVPTENMEYIRHLGQPSPIRQDGSDAGWVYLNLLASMAQLHTINVTPEFIKAAVRDMSEKFELSADGRKIRWRGGEDGTLFSSDSGSNAEAGNTESPPESSDSQRQSTKGGSSVLASKRLPSSDILSSRPLPSLSTGGRKLQSDNMDRSSSSQIQHSTSSNQFDYKPLLLRAQRSTEESDESGYPELESQFSASRFGLDDTTGHSSSIMVNGSGDRQSAPSSRGDGPMIYYRDAGYYTDLHGERKPLSKAKPPVEVDRPILGIPRVENVQADTDEHQALPKSEVRPIQPSEIDEKQLPVLKLMPLSDVTELHQNFQELPVSGVGGVVPNDNFLIDVKTNHSLRPSIAGKQIRKRPAKNYRVVSAQKLDLPPSRLPPPSYIFLPFTSSSSSDLEYIDDDDEFTGSSVDENLPAPPAMLHQMTGSSEEVEDLPMFDADEEDDDDEEDEDDESGDGEDDDSSIDMLHTARVANPEAIAAREREYEMNTIGPVLRNELSAGSSVATAGGGSDYGSPLGSPTLMHMDPPSLKRGRNTSDAPTNLSKARKTPRK